MEAPAPDDARTLGPYRVGRVLGSGGMATVYHAVDGHGTAVALKVLAEDLAQRDGFRERFRTEAALATAVRHDRLVACLAMGEDDGRSWMALEYCPGGDCQALLLRNGHILECERALSLCRDVASALVAVDRRGLLHRDIKPANMLLDGEGRAKLGDLGLSILVESKADGKLPIGTPAYCAPEQARGRGGVDIRADIYSMGATLFRFLSGRLLFDGVDALSVIAQVLKDPLPDIPAALPQVPPVVHRLIADCCHRDPDRRPATPAVLCERIDEALAESRAALRGGAVVPPAAPDEPDLPLHELRKRVDPDRLAALARMIVVDADGLVSVIKLAPGASFRRSMLRLILAEADIRHGIDDAALRDATRPADHPRRLVIARGDAPAPGLGGRDVHGDPIPPRLSSVEVRVDDDGREAVALMRPGSPAEPRELQAELRSAGIRFGLDPAAVLRCTEGPIDASGRVVLARCRPVVPASHPGWRLQVQAHGDDLPRVRRGDRIASWRDGSAGEPGMDVLGNRLDPGQPARRIPEDCAGDGTTIQHQAGETMLLATRTGIVRCHPDGRVAVVGAVEVDGDLDGDSPPVESDDLVLVRGSLGPGARVHSAREVVVLGDVRDAEISAGGDVEVAGAVTHGPPIHAGGEVRAGSVAGRPVIAGSLRVEGTITGARIHVTGDVEANAIVGGEVVAGGSIRVSRLGDREATTTLVRSGGHLAIAQQRLLNRLRQQRVESERRALVDQRNDLLREREAVAQRSRRHRQADVVVAKAMAQLRNLEASLDRRLAHIEGEGEALRSALAGQVQTTSMADAAVAKAVVEGTRIAHSGVNAAIGDAPPEALDAPRLQYRLAFGDGGSAVSPP